MQITCKAKGYPKPIHLWQTDLQDENLGFISCNWSGIVDPQSRIISYAVSIGTSPSDQSVLSCIDADIQHQINSYSSPLIGFELGMPYFLTLYVTNGAGLERIFTSDPVYFDATPPVYTGAVSVIRNFGTGEYNGGNVMIDRIGTESAVCLYDTDITSIIFHTQTDPESNSTFW